MGHILLVGRLALRDLRRRRTEAVLLLIAIVAATTTLTLGLVLRDAAGGPYESTRAATSGPDVVAAAGAGTLEELATAPGVVGHSGPYPVAGAHLQTPHRSSDVQVVGRDAEPAQVDQPELVQGDWVSDGGVVAEAAFAAELDLHAGDQVTLNGRSFRVAGVAVSAAMPPYPGSSCLISPGCLRGAVPEDRALPAGLLKNPGLLWLTRADALSLGSVSSVMNLKLADPGSAPAFVDAHLSEDAGAVRLTPWQTIIADATELAADSQILLLIGAWLLGLLAVASLSVLVGGRMADQTRRVGLLKAVGGTPGLVAAVLLAEYLLVAVVAAAAGLAIGTLSAPLLTESSAGLFGSARTPSLTWSTAAVVTAVAVGVAMLATAVPAVRGARTSTVHALADAARPPRRVGWLITLSARLPVPLLLALRVAARRPRRAVLATTGIAVTVSGIYVLLLLTTFLDTGASTRGYSASQIEVLRHVLGFWTVILLVLAGVNAVVITWATVLDNRHASALARALGATTRQVTTALAVAQVLPALLGAVLGVFPGGFLLFSAIMAATGSDRDEATLPSLGQSAAVVLATDLVVAALAAVPARLGARRPVAQTL